MEKFEIVVKFTIEAKNKEEARDYVSDVVLSNIRELEGLNDEYESEPKYIGNSIE